MKQLTVAVILACVLPAFADDSPLVAAAKRTNRLNKKPAFVITNETLAQMNGGRSFTTTSAQQMVTMPPPTVAPPSQADLMRQKEANAKVVAAQKKVRDERMAKAQQKAMQYEDESYLDDDPAAAEHALEMMTRPSEPPKSTPSQKPPQN